MKPSPKIAELTTLIEPAVNACDVSLWGLEFAPQGKKSLLRIYIEASPENQQVGKQVTIEDCAAVTHQVSGVLEVHDPIAGEYILEVSSPGLDRPLFSLEQIQAYPNKLLQLRLIHPIKDGEVKRRKMSGRLQNIDGSILSIATSDGKLFTVDANNIDKAHLIYEDE